MRAVDVVGTRDVDVQWWRRLPTWFEIAIGPVTRSAAPPKGDLSLACGMSRGGTLAQSASRRQRSS